MEAEDCEIEQPWPPMRISVTTASSPLDASSSSRNTTISSPHSGLKPSDPMGGGHRQLTTVPRVAVVVEDDLAVEVFEARHWR